MIMYRLQHQISLRGARVLILVALISNMTTKIVVRTFLKMRNLHCTSLKSPEQLYHCLVNIFNYMCIFSGQSSSCDSRYVCCCWRPLCMSFVPAFVWSTRGRLDFNLSAYFMVPVLHSNAYHDEQYGSHTDCSGIILLPMAIKTQVSFVASTSTLLKCLTQVTFAL
jgi:hypothetical protein